MPRALIAKVICVDNPEDIVNDERRRGFETKLSKTFQEVSLKQPEDNVFVVCPDCGDQFQEEYTELTGKCCPDCFRERAFMVIPGITTTVGAGTHFSFFTIDDDPYVHNARRAIDNHVL